MQMREHQGASCHQEPKNKQKHLTCNLNCKFRNLFKRFVHVATIQEHGTLCQIYFEFFWKRLSGFAKWKSNSTERKSNEGERMLRIGAYSKPLSGCLYNIIFSSIKNRWICSRKFLRKHLNIWTANTNEKWKWNRKLNWLARWRFCEKENVCQNQIV